MTGIPLIVHRKQYNLPVIKLINRYYIIWVVKDWIRIMNVINNSWKITIISWRLLIICLRKSMEKAIAIKKKCRIRLSNWMKWYKINLLRIFRILKLPILFRPIKWWVLIINKHNLLKIMDRIVIIKYLSLNRTLSFRIIFSCKWRILMSRNKIRNNSKYYYFIFFRNSVSNNK
jgi:hypothetical protein